MWKTYSFGFWNGIVSNILRPEKHNLGGKQTYIQRKTEEVIGRQKNKRNSEK